MGWISGVRQRSPGGRGRPGWLNRTVLGVGFASFLSDVSHETATSVLPLLAANLGNPGAVLGAIEGFADAASGVTKLWSGWISDNLRRRKPLAVLGYVVTAAATGSLGSVTAAWQAVAARAAGWAGRGLRSAPRNALLAGDVLPADYGRAFGFERAMDSAGAILGPLAAVGLVVVLPTRAILWWTLVPGLLAALAMAVLVRERPRDRGPRLRFLGALTALPAAYRSYLLAVGLFGIGDFAHALLILRATEVLRPAAGEAGAAMAAIGLYVAHNVAGAALALPFGAAGDRFGRARMLVAGYLLGPLMIVLLVVPGLGLPVPAWPFLAAAFVVGGALLAAEEALENAVAAEILPEERRGIGFGALAAVNSLGDLVSSLGVGLLWKAAGPSIAIGIAAIPMAAGALLLALFVSRRSGGEAPPARSAA